MTTPVAGVLRDVVEIEDEGLTLICIAGIDRETVEELGIATDATGVYEDEMGVEITTCRGPRGGLVVSDRSAPCRVLRVLHHNRGAIYRHNWIAY